jgi:hypothetical protein
VDIATMQREKETTSSNSLENGGIAVAAWAPPTTTVIMPTVFPDEFEVQIFRTFGGDSLVGAIELVSPSNKDRPEARRAFAAKCAAYLQLGVGLVVVDIVTDRRANLHNELIQLLQQDERFGFDPPTFLYMVAYRPSRTASGDQIEIWQMPTAVGQDLPIAPLALRGLATVPVDLEATYRSTCIDARL